MANDKHKASDPEPETFLSAFGRIIRGFSLPAEMLSLFETAFAMLDSTESMPRGATFNSRETHAANVSLTVERNAELPGRFWVVLNPLCGSGPLDAAYALVIALGKLLYPTSDGTNGKKDHHRPARDEWRKACRIAKDKGTIIAGDKAWDTLPWIRAKFAESNGKPNPNVMVSFTTDSKVLGVVYVSLPALATPEKLAAVGDLLAGKIKVTGLTKRAQKNASVYSVCVPAPAPAPPPAPPQS